MINLLPPKEKIEFFQEETKRLVVIIGSGVLVSLFCLILILFSIKIYISGQAESQKIILLQTEKEFQTSEMKNLQEKIILTNLTLSKLNSFYQEKFYLTKVLERISEILPPGTYLANLSFTPRLGEEFRAEVSLSGFSSSREILFEFKKNLEAQEDFKEIYFPPASWIKPTDVDFSLTFKIKKK